MKTLHYIAFTLAILIAGNSYAQTNVSLDDPNLHYDGAFYTEVTPTLVTFNRHSSEVYNNTESGIYGSWIRQWVITQTGMRIRFKTASPSIAFTFQQRSGGGIIGANPANGFTVYADSVLLQSYSTLSFNITNPNPGTETFFEVVLPDLWAVDLTGMELASGFNLVNADFTYNKPVLITIGDSITHGTGQYVSSAKTYAFLLAKSKGWNLYNMAVAGATLGWAMALNVKDKQADIITVLIGFNDWKYTNDALSVKQEQYERLIDSLRSYQPHAKIYCITPLVTTDNSGAAPYTIQEFRDMVSEVVGERMLSDDKIFLISGPAISNAGMLAPGDPVHLGEPGAAAFAVNLEEGIEHPESVTSVQPTSIIKKKINIERMTASDIYLEIMEANNYSITVYTPDGKEVYHQDEIPLAKGDFCLKWNSTHEYFSPVYIVRIQLQQNIESELIPVK